MYLNQDFLLGFLAVEIIHPTDSIGAVYRIVFFPSDSSSPGTSRPWLLKVHNHLEVPHFKRLLRHLPTAEIDEAIERINTHLNA